MCSSDAPVRKWRKPASGLGLAAPPHRIPAVWGQNLRSTVKLLFEVRRGQTLGIHMDQ